MNLTVILSILHALLVSAALEALDECKESKYVGGKYYRPSVFANVSAYNHIVIDGNNNVFFRNVPIDSSMYMWGSRELSPTVIAGLSQVLLNDFTVDDKGDIFISTSNGVYKYNYGTSSATFFAASGMNFWKLTTSANGSVYGTTDGCTMYHIDKAAVKQLNIVPRANAFAFNSQGDLYYVANYSSRPHVLRNGHHQPTAIQGVDSTWTNLIVIDDDDNVYLCRDDGLYFVKPSSDIANRIDGYDKILAMGFDKRGNIYLGMWGQIHKLEPLPCNPCDSATSEVVLRITNDMMKKIEALEKKNKDLELRIRHIENQRAV